MLGKLWRTKLWRVTIVVVLGQCAELKLWVEAKKVTKASHVQVLQKSDHNCKVWWTGKIFIILSHSLRRCGRNPFFQSDRYVKLWWYQTQKALCGRQKMEKLIILTKHVQWIFHCIQLCRCVAYWRKWPFHYSIFQRFSSFLNRLSNFHFAPKTTNTLHNDFEPFSVCLPIWM